MYLSLQAASVCGEFVCFTIQDCPKLVDDELFYLANKPGSPLLRKNAIYRGTRQDGKLKPVRYGKVRYRILSQGIEFNLFDIIAASGEYALIYKGGGMVVPFTDIADAQFTRIHEPL